MCSHQGCRSLKEVPWIMSTLVIWLKQSQILIIYWSGCIWHVCTLFPSRKMLTMPPAATASPLGASHLHTNCWTAAWLPTAEPPSTAWRKSTKVISRLPATEEGLSADISQREREWTRQTEIITFIKLRGDSQGWRRGSESCDCWRWGWEIRRKGEVKGLPNGQYIDRSIYREEEIRALDLSSETGNQLF